MQRRHRQILFLQDFADKDVLLAAKSTVLGPFIFISFSALQVCTSGSIIQVPGLRTSAGARGAAIRVPSIAMASPYLTSEKDELSLFGSASKTVSSSGFHSVLVHNVLGNFITASHCASRLLLWLSFIRRKSAMFLSRFDIV